MEKALALALKEGPGLGLGKFLWKVLRPISIVILGIWGEYGRIWGESGGKLGGKALKDAILH